MTPVTIPVKSLTARALGLSDRVDGGAGRAPWSAAREGAAPRDDGARSRIRESWRNTVMIARRLVLVALSALFAAALLSPAPAAAEDPAKIFARSCAPCHGKEGEPNAVFAKQGVRNFKDAAWQKATTEAQVEKTIRDGKKGTMMASFEKQLSAEEIKGLAAYIRTLGKK